MKNKLITFSIITGIFLAGCTSEPVVETQHECLEQGLFNHDGKCVKYESIPKEDLPDVWGEVADEIAEANGISKTEAMKMILDELEQ